MQWDQLTIERFQLVFNSNPFAEEILAGSWQLRGFNPNPQLVPEPATVALLGIGIVGIAGTEVRRRRKKKAVDNS